MGATKYKFSLIMSTVDRTDQVAEFIASLAKQSYKNCQLIIVDQNEDERLKDIAESDLDIIRLRSEKGLSRGRNVGLIHAAGDIVAFPDDDCLYPPELLADIARWFEQNEQYAGLSGISVDFNGSPTVGRFDIEPGSIDKFNIWQRMTSIGFFIRKEAIGENIYFDENLGVGAGTVYGSAEDIDFPLQLLAHGHRLYYNPAIQIIHPPVTETYDATARRRGLLYGGGIGYVLEKHRYPLSFLLKMLIRPFGGMIISILSLKFTKACFHWNVFRGRLRGVIR